MNLRILFVLCPLLLIFNDSIAQWYQISNLANRTFTDLYFVNDSIDFITGSEYVYKTTDGGSNWDSTQLFEYGDLLMEIGFAKNDTGYIVGSISGYNELVTVDNGNSWQPIAPWAANTDVAIANGNESFRSSDGSPGLYRFNLESLSLTEMNPGLASINDIACLDENTIYVGGGGASGSFSKSIDGGETWTISDMPLGILWMSFPSSQVGYVSNSLLYKTIDSGNSWEPLTLPYYFENCSDPFFVDDSIGYFSCVYDEESYYHGIVKTIDGGNSWIFCNTIPVINDAVSAIHCLNKDTCWCVTYSGQVYKTTNGGGEALPPLAVYDNTLNTFNVYPNPANDIIKIILPVSDPIISIKTYNLFGQKLNLLNIGNSTLILDGLQPGVYTTIVETKKDKFSCSWIKN